MYSIKTIAVALFVFLFMDGIWLGFLGKNFYVEEIGDLMRSKPNFLAAALVYILLIAGILIFVLPKASGDPIAALGFGALFGLVCYGIYDFTNLAIINKWTLTISLIDMTWGAIICGAASSISSMVK